MQTLKRDNRKRRVSNPCRSVHHKTHQVGSFGVALLGSDQANTLYLRLNYDEINTILSLRSVFLRVKTDYSIKETKGDIQGGKQPWAY